MGEIRAFTILGKPVPKARPRFNSKTGKCYTAKDTAEYSDHVKMCYKQQIKEEPYPKDEPLKMTVETYHQIPKRSSIKIATKMQNQQILPTKRPDVDNVLKAIMDALNGIAYHDDCQIVEVVCKKYYCHTPRVYVRIEVADVEL